MAARQLSLFDDDSPAGGRGAEPVVRPAMVDETTRRLGLALDRRIRLGTSSWSFPGWAGLVYDAGGGRPPGEQRLARAGLSAYAAHPLFRTVSLDRTFYAPLAAADFARYAAQVPDGFRFVVKAPAAVTDPVVRRPGSGETVGDNPTFLDAEAAVAGFVRPAVEGLGETCGPLVFQFPPLGRRLLADLPALERRIAAFMAAVSRGGPAAAASRLAVEVRDPQLASAGFAWALADAGAAPCLAVHARMPPVEEQAAALVGMGAEGPPLVVRWNLHAGRRYEEARADYFPFDRLVEEDVQTRAGLARLARSAAADGREVFITINNKAEGCGPLSVRRLAERIVAEDLRASRADC